MNIKKICFVTCVNDDALYRKCLFHINNLALPDGFELETRCIRNARSITSGFNEVMRQTDAKYKVYLHQDVFIINKHFISDVISIFQDDQIGMIGVAGCARIPASGIWWESDCNFGKVYDSHTGTMQQLAFQEVEGEYQEVQCIDGLIMVSQYDIAWREDIFTGWHFYDASQCMEFLRVGYKIVIPRQHGPWCIHDCETVNVNNGYWQFCQVFLSEYAHDIAAVYTETNIDDRPVIAVGVLTYNHEKYIRQCLEGIVLQTGNFKLRVVICDDNSNDKTTEIIEHFMRQQVAGPISFTVIKNPNNIGITKNLGQCVRLCEGADYFAFCEGDDYWTASDKLQTQMNYLINNPQCSLCFNSIVFYYESENRFEPYQEHQERPETVFMTKELVTCNFIGNFSCCFYNAKYIKLLRNELFDNLFTVDWMFNIVYSEFGNIGYIKRPMSVYRKHGSGSWSSQELYEQNRRLIRYIDEYNAFLQFRYDAQFTGYRNKCVFNIGGEEFKLAIIDDVFPHPLSGFRYQEFLSYLQTFVSVKIVTSGVSLPCLGGQTAAELLVNFKKEYPKFAANVEEYEPASFTTIKCNMFYFVFLSNAYNYVNLAESRQVPFVFTLYPGGAFAFNNPTSDAMLRRVVCSPYFKSVIVTQKVVCDYLLEKKFCKPEQMEYVFGVVTPLTRLEQEYNSKMHFGFEKDSLDICFVAHKYTLYGEDKGYDVFIATAKLLCSQYANVNFHVVGNFNEQTIDVSVIKDRITFYGVQEQAWFDGFYRDKDMILSPNIPGKVFEGAFDGFPTASCIDAGIRKVAIFATDPLHMNNGYFSNGEEIVIVEHEAAKIAEKISYYYDNPCKLRSICENGCSRIKDIYSYDKQIRPRIELLTKVLSGDNVEKQH